MPDVLLEIGGRSYGGWKTVEIVRSIETIAGAFTLGVSERWAGQQAVAAITPGDACRLSIDDETVITGFVDDVEPEYDAENHLVTVRGRDAAGDLVDSSVLRDGVQFPAGPVLAMIAELCRPFGIDVSATVPVPSLLGFTLQYGETVFEAIDRLSALAGVLPTSDGQGGLVLTNAGAAGVRGALRLGDNIKKARGHYSFKDRFSLYIVSGQTPGGDNTDPNTATFGTGKATDPGTPRYRPLIIMPPMPEASPALFQRRAEWEATVRLGRAWRATITVNGWRDAAGALWLPNTLAQVDDDFLAVHDTLLISGVKLTIGEDGVLAELTVTRREAFDLVPLGGVRIYDPAPAEPRLFPPPSTKDGHL